MAVFRQKNWRMIFLSHTGAAGYENHFCVISQRFQNSLRVIRYNSRIDGDSTVTRYQARQHWTIRIGDLVSLGNGTGR
jgi:hypothetical protein